MTNLDLNLGDVRFVVVDVESTGGTSGEHKMIEIAMVVVEGGVVVARHETLIDPHEPIPEFIQRMTGITDEMVKGQADEEEALAPLFEELLNPNSVFVAHNVGFDWSFIQKAYLKYGGLVPDITRICTCKLSRRLHTQLSRHDLASVAEFCGVVIEGRHRAMGDTDATWQALVQMIELAQQDHDAQTLGDLVALQYAPRTVPRRETKKRAELEQYLREIPDEPGVYYFLSSKRNLLYVGKAKSLKKRVNTYFHDAPLHGRSVSRMIRYIKHIQWETTGTELGALLLESREIKVRRPSYNVASREYHAPSFLRITNEAYPRLEIVDHVDDDGSEYYGPFRSARMAERICEMITRAYKLRTCSGELHPAVDVRPCFDYHIKRCDAPCALHQTIDDYRASVVDARDQLANIERGTTSLLRQRMDLAAESMAFEEAAMYRDGIREIERLMMHQTDTPLAVTNVNMIIAVPTSDRYATVELYAMRSGRLRLQRVVGLKALNHQLIEDLRSVFVAPPPSGRFTDVEMDELRIITSWLHQRREHAFTHIVDLSTSQLEDHIAQVLQHLASDVRRRSEVIAAVAPPSEYSQIPPYAD
ncbi:MAG: hypothetical protein EHM43_04080 [Ignavibacteriae bacterium]|nr:MAG: hypothetical protein EHM43_04080 [Ignavibacteriota bacterium]